MKFARSFLLTILGSHRPARPAVVEKGVGVEKAVGDCNSDYGRAKMDGWCQWTNKVPINKFTDEGWVYDDNYECPGTCCSGDLGFVGQNEKCRCLHKGEPHAGPVSRSGYASWVYYCCSLVDRNGGTQTTMDGYVATAPLAGNTPTHCGCADIGDKVFRPGVAESDCCSGKWHSTSNKTCVPAECTHAGATGDDDCCGYMANDGIHAGKTDDGKCKCIPHGQELNRWQQTTGSDCCSGVLLPNSNICGCIESTEVALSAGASKHDCCGGETQTTDQGEFCKAGACSPPGQAIAGGAHCCSGKDTAQVCECLHGGEDLPDGVSALTNCCSGAAEGGKCTWLPPGATPNPYDSDRAGQCGSGNLDSEGHCACGKPNSQLAHPSVGPNHCCSGGFNQAPANLPWMLNTGTTTTGPPTTTTSGAGTCSCINNGGLLAPDDGANFCCSRNADQGQCACAFAGRPAWSSSSTGSECCSGYQDNGYCGCKESGSTNIPEGMCCGGYKNGTDRCTCIPDFTLVAAFVRPSACCSGQIVGDGTASSPRRCTPFSSTTLPPPDFTTTVGPSTTSYDWYPTTTTTGPPTTSYPWPPPRVVAPSIPLVFR